MTKSIFTSILVIVTFATSAQNKTQVDLKAYDQIISGTNFNLKMMPIEGG